MYPILSIRPSLIDGLMCVSRAGSFRLSRRAMGRCMDTRIPQEGFLERVSAETQIDLFDLVLKSSSWPCKSVLALRRGVFSPFSSFEDLGLHCKQSLSGSFQKHYSPQKSQDLPSRNFFLSHSLTPASPPSSPPSLPYSHPKTPSN